MKIRPVLTSLQKGFMIPNLIAVSIMALTKFLQFKGTGVLIFSEFIIIPILIGVFSAWYWRNLLLKGSTLTLYSGYNAGIAILLSFLFLGEGVICLLIVSPLIWCFILVGAFIGRSMFYHNDSTLNVSVVALLSLIFVGDSLSKHQYQNLVGDQIVINAPPARVWPHVVSFAKIKQQNNFWLFKIGMPSPMETTVTGNYKGAGRKCIFSNGYVFDEEISTYDVNRNLTFDITHQPRDPEIMGHIDILRGQFLLKDNGNGTTTLTGNSWYKLYVFPIWYYDLWAESVTRNVHLGVMHHIKELSEQ
jgi:hypothetical protein